MATKDINKAIIKEQIWKIGEINKNATKAKDAYRKRLAELELQKDNYSGEYLKELQDKARAELATKNAAAYEDWKAQAEKLQAALVELESQLVVDPALRDTIGIIKDLGKNLDTETIQRLNAQFA